MTQLFFFSVARPEAGFCQNSSVRDDGGADAARKRDLAVQQRRGSGHLRRRHPMQVRPLRHVRRTKHLSWPQRSTLKTFFPKSLAV